MEYPNKRSDIDITFDSVNDINGIVDGSLFPDDSQANKKAQVKRNVEHLQIVKSGSYVDLSQFSADEIATIDAAISTGNTYVSSL
jgi:hypothetical protein